MCLKCLNLEDTWSIRFKWKEVKRNGAVKSFYHVIEFVGGDTPVCAIKLSILSVVSNDCNPETAVLLYNGIELSDEEKTLKDYNVSSGFLVMILKNRDTCYFII